MKTIRRVAEVRAELVEARRRGAQIGLVPTMGAFHDGHLSLIRRARSECEVVVVSLFVNPTQFNESGDLTAYPRDEARDAALAAELGVDYLFAPPVEEVYPAGFATTVSVGGLTERLEGEHRGRAHFDGVTTVVTKLFTMVAPDVAYFGQKDFQQSAVIRRLVRDLDLPVAIEVCPTVRESDGLAMSSRNVHLSPADRRRATALHRGLTAAERALTGGVREPAALIAAARAELDAEDIEPEYLEIVDADTLAPVRVITGDALVLVAARVGSTRLIDNHLLSPARRGSGMGQPRRSSPRAARLAVSAGTDNHGRH
jgi:pantoate--beta-alanine ligase